jgi:hypothetical protein
LTAPHKSAPLRGALGAAQVRARLDGERARLLSAQQPDVRAALDELRDHTFELARREQLVQAPEAADDALAHAPSLAGVLDDVQVLVVAAVGSHPL